MKCKTSECYGTAENGSHCPACQIVRGETVTEIAEKTKRLERFYLNGEGRLEATPHGALVRIKDVWNLIKATP